MAAQAARAALADIQRPMAPVKVDRLERSIHGSQMFRKCVPHQVLYHPPSPFMDAAVTVVRDDDLYSLLHTQIPTPSWGSALYQQIADVASVPNIPILVWLREAGGYGGFFAHHYIAVGEKDVREIAERVCQRRFVPVPSEWMGLFPNATTKNDVSHAAFRVLLAHELGHAFRSRTGTASIGIPEEAGADVITGWIAEALGWPAWIDELIMAEIGCLGTEDVCGHPSPEGRVNAYRQGRQSHRQQMQQAAQMQFVQMPFSQARYRAPQWG